MAETLIIDKAASKAEKYQALIPQIQALITGETDLIANLANISAALHEGMDFFWVGFYIAKEGQLVLAPFQGPIACTRIPFSKGVCGAAYSQQKTVIVKDVNEFPGHIACSSASVSEIVVPIFKGQKVVAILDVDSTEYADFDEVDKKYLEELASFMSSLF